MGSKGAVTKAIATERELKQKDCSAVINSLVAIATNEVKKAGVFTIPGVCRIKTRLKPATKAGVRMMFGKETKDRCEGLPRGCAEEADLGQQFVVALHHFSR